MFWDRLQLYLTPISWIQRFRWGILYAFYFHSTSGKTPQMSLQSFYDKISLISQANSAADLGWWPSFSASLSHRRGRPHGLEVISWFPLFPCEMSASCFIQSLGDFWRGATRIFWKMLGSQWNKWRLRFWSHTMFYVFFWLMGTATCRTIPWLKNINYTYFLQPAQACWSQKRLHYRVICFPCNAV